MNADREGYVLDASRMDTPMHDLDEEHARVCMAVLRSALSCLISWHPTMQCETRQSTEAVGSADNHDTQLLTTTGHSNAASNVVFLFISLSLHLLADICMNASKVSFFRPIQYSNRWKMF